jgi:N-acetylneuraminic acid mutarotase
MPIARSEHGVAALDGELYVLGGFTPTVTSSVQVYSPEQASWRDAADFPVVFHHPNVASAGGLLYVLGFHAGSGQRAADGSAYAYDPETDSWTERAPLPLGTERGASCVTSFEDKIYVFGGTNDIALAEASVYLPAEDRWEALPLLPVARHHCIAAVVSDKIYIVSGRDVVIEEVQTESFVFDPVALSYEEVAPIPTPRGGAAGGELGGRIYVFGGEGNVNDDNGIFHDAEEYDPSTDTWASLPDMVVPRHGLGAAVIGDRMYLPGGSTSQGIDAKNTHTVFYFEAP